MKKARVKQITLKPIHRIFLFSLGLLMFAFGILTFVGGNLEFSNYRGVGVEFAPFAVLIGAVAIIAGFARRNS
jgi:uncharacterized membrane protein